MHPNAFRAVLFFVLPYFNIAADMDFITFVQRVADNFSGLTKGDYVKKLCFACLFPFIIYVFGNAEFRNGSAVLAKGNFRVFRKSSVI